MKGFVVPEVLGNVTFHSEGLMRDENLHLAEVCSPDFYIIKASCTLSQNFPFLVTSYFPYN